MVESITSKRQTTETDIRISIDLEQAGVVSIDTGLPFFDHMLNAMAFHGGFMLTVEARGDIEVDPHHLVEDTGLVLGDCLATAVETYRPIHRYGYAVIPMDDALSEVTIDACGRPYLDFRADFPQSRSGEFDMWLVREFLLGLTNRSKINLHARCRYGINSHHMAEALFKALGISLKKAFSPAGGKVRSTKGVLHEDKEN